MCVVCWNRLSGNCQSQLRATYDTKLALSVAGCTVFQMMWTVRSTVLGPSCTIQPPISGADKAASIEICNKFHFLLYSNNFYQTSCILIKNYHLYFLLQPSYFSHNGLEYYCELKTREVSDSESLCSTCATTGVLCAFAKPFLSSHFKFSFKLLAKTTPPLCLTNRFWKLDSSHFQFVKNL